MKRSGPFRTLYVLLCFCTISLWAQLLQAEPWKFGVMGDTQWTTTDPAGANPSSVPLSIIGQVNRQFIDAKVKFVIQVGDLTDDGEDVSERTRAAAAQPLVDAGIGFFAFRGNHETSRSDNGYGVPVFRANYPQNRTGEFSRSDSTRFVIGTSFSSPVNVSQELDGLSYSFDYGDGQERARFVFIDPWPCPGMAVRQPNGRMAGYSIDAQQAWITGRLDRKARGTEHAFVFSHQPIIAENHQDTMFGGFTNANPEWQNRFMASLQQNGVRYYISGHDHLHQRSLVQSPDKRSKVEELIAASNSSKFYKPKPIDDPDWYGQKVRETSISQECFTVGYYIFTVDGPSVTVDFYSDDHGNWRSDSEFPEGAGKPGVNVTPKFHFVKKESWGYFLNGKQFVVPQGESYRMVRDRYKGTVVRIIDGRNESLARDATLDTIGGQGRRLVKIAGTGWLEEEGGVRSEKSGTAGNYPGLASKILVLNGMADPGTGKTDVYTLSISYDPAKMSSFGNEALRFGLVTKSADGRWINAVRMNSGGQPKYIDGPWKKGYGLGSYGVDRKNRTAWAVLDYNASFAASAFEER